MYWQNGQVVESVTATDRSFQYGDGCFTTMLTKQGQIQHWAYHHERMVSCLDYLGITPPDWQQVVNWLAQAVISTEKAGVKLHISRGCGGRGYSPTQLTQANVTISTFDFPNHYAQWREQGLRLGICSQQMGLNPLLAGHKHNNRLEQVLLKGEMDRAGFADGVCLDLHGHVVETTMANLFWIKGDVLYTPSLHNAGVAGVARRVILQMATSLGITVEVNDFSIEHLLDAEEVFISNALLELAPVIGVATHNYAIGTYVRRFQEMFNS